MTAKIKTSTQSSSNQVLFRGTTKATLHIPGYVGHIPANRAINSKEVHCNGEKHRPKDHNLTLTYPVLGRLPGYVGMILFLFRLASALTFFLDAGHIPKFPVNQKKKY